MGDSSQPQLSQSFLTDMQSNMTAGAVEAILWGTLLPLAVMAVYTLVRQSLRRPGRRFLLAAVLVSLLSSTIILTTDYAGYFLDITKLTDPASRDLLIRISATGTICDRINYVISDCIVVWRAWILSDSLFQRVALGSFLSASIICSLTEGIITVIWQFSAPVDAQGKRAALDLILFVPLIATNLLSTSFICYKTWLYRRQIKIHFDRQSGRRRIERVLLLLIESGIFYAAFWILAAVIAFGYGTFFPLTGSIIVEYSLPYLAALYPITVILIVSVYETNPSLPTLTLTDISTHSIRLESTTAQHIPNNPTIVSSHYQSQDLYSQSIIQSLATHVCSLPTLDEESEVGSVSDVDPKT